MLKIVIAGSSDFSDYRLFKEKVDSVVNRLMKNRAERYVKIYTGDHEGVDDFAKKYAEENSFFVSSYLKKGIVDTDILDEKKIESADIVIVFTHPDSYKSEEILNLAKQNGVTTITVNSYKGS